MTRELYLSAYKQMTTRDLFFKEEQRSRMARLTARVIVTPKPVVNDPQGITVKGGLHRLGLPRGSDVRVGQVHRGSAGGGGRG